jgi:alpha-tubulin suppressor-like RCC1 family protein
MSRGMRLSMLRLLAGLCSLSMGCSTEEPTGTAQVVSAIQQALSAHDVVRVELTVSAADMAPRHEALTRTDNQWGGILGQLPAGSGRTFHAQAFNASQALIYEGEAMNVTITAGSTTVVSLMLQQVDAPPPFENAAPTITSLIASRGSVEPGGTVALQATAEDANPGDALTFAWTGSAGSFTSASSLSTSWSAPSQPGPVSLTLTVTDSQGASSTVSLTIMVRASTGTAAVNVAFNSWPQVSNISASSTNVEVNETTTLLATASDNDGDTLHYQWTASCPGTWSDANALSSRFTPAAPPAPSATCTPCALTVTVTDGRGGQTTGSLSICVGPKPAAHLPPVLEETYQSTASVPQNDPVTLRVRATDPQGSPLSFSWAANMGTLAEPTEAANASEILWTAPACIPAEGPPSITVTVTNALGLSTSASFSVSGGEACAGLRILAAAVGTVHTVVLKEDGTVWTSGDNSSGQLGDGTTTSRLLPVQALGLTQATAVASGWAHSVALKADGTVWAWGRNLWGELGDGTTTGRATPGQVQGLTHVTAIAAGQGHTVALKDDGTVWSWGLNQAGALGDGTLTNRATPVQVQGLTQIIEIAVGDEHNAALKADGTVWTWGRNDWGQIGNGTVRVLHPAPVQVPGLTQVTAIAAGSYYILAARADGTVWSWGGNNEGQLGDGTTETRTMPVQVQNLTQVFALSASGNHAVALKQDGTVWDWGYNIAGPPSVRTLPVQVPGLSQVTGLAAGSNATHSIVLKGDGTAWAWGWNNNGQFGDGTVTRHSTPVELTHFH